MLLQTTLDRIGLFAAPPASAYFTRSKERNDDSAPIDPQLDGTRPDYAGQPALRDHYNPRSSNTVPGSGMLVTPKAGLTSIPIYGRAYPEAAAYPVGTRPQSIVPIYTIPAGQVYVASGKFQSDYYYAPTYAPELAGSDHVVVKGQTEYYQIWYNHRFAFVKASDVELVTAP